MKRIWLFMINPFLTATFRNFRMALEISTKHDAALNALKNSNPFFANLYATYHALHLEFDALYTKWKGQGGTQKGATFNLKQLLRLLAHTKIGDWERAIHNVYQPDSPQYKRLLPNLKSPFQRGDQLSRINAVEILGLAIGSDSNLAIVKSSVDAFYSQLLDANTSQKGSKSYKSTLSHNLEAKRLIICAQLFGNYGLLADHYKDKPENIAKFFDITAIRSLPRELFTGKVKASHLHTIKEHTFETGDTLLILNNGDAALKFYLAQRRDVTSYSTFVEVEAGEERIVIADQLGDIANTFLIAINEQHLDGHFEVELL